jgi:hypothetical protein
MLKKWVIVGCALLLSLTSLSVLADTEDATANIRIKLSNPAHDNRYFLCMQGVGCLSVLAAQKGKVYPVFHSVEMDNLYVNNVSSMRLSPQGLPKSCDTTVQPNQTITISGQIIPGPDDSAYIKNLHCTVS